MARRSTRLTFACALACALVACKASFHAGSGDFDAGDFGPSGGGGSGSTTKKDAGKTPMKTADGGMAMSGEEDAGPLPDAGSPKDGGGPAVGSAPESWATALAQATCDALLDCYGGNADLLTDTLGGRDCATLNESLLRSGQTRYLPDSVKAGLVQYHPAELSACLADVRALGCNVRASRLPASCRMLIVGTKLTADQCTIDLDCKADAFCDKGALATCPGVCAPLQGEDLPCNNANDAQCADGLVCFMGSCKPLREDGQSCDATLPKCKPGLVCVDPGSGAVCTAVATVYAKKMGEACDPVSNVLCGKGLVCQSVSATTGMCAPPAAKDGTCKRGQPDPCPADQYCDATAPGADGTCRNRPGDGEACLATNRTPRCTPSAICISDVCHTLQAIGSPCTDNGECYSGSCGSSGNCEGPLMCAPP